METDMSKVPTYSSECVLVSIHAVDQALVNTLTTIVDKLRNGTAPLTESEEELVGRITEGYRRGRRHTSTT
jgi:hypothetical protein